MFQAEIKKALNEGMTLWVSLTVGVICSTTVYTMLSLWGLGERGSILWAFPVLVITLVVSQIVVARGPARFRQRGNSPDELSARQKRILAYVESFTLRRGYPPSAHEIQEFLESAKDGKPVPIAAIDRDLRLLEGIRPDYAERRVVNESSSRRTVAIPLVGMIAAGVPITVPDDLAADEVVESIELGAELLPLRSDDLFALRVKGHSMVDALIEDGDIVVLRAQAQAESGDAVAAWLKDRKETTLKRIYYEGARVRLQPANVAMEPIYTTPDNVEIQGRLVMVLRPMA